MENLIRAKVVGLSSEKLNPKDLEKGIKQIIVVETQEILKTDTGDLTSTIFKRLKSEVLLPKTAIGTVMIFNVKITVFESEMYYKVLSVAKV